MTSDWTETTLGEAVQVNPRISLKKGTVTPYVGMADLNEHARRIPTFAEREYKSGSKFQRGDTLMARITPCLENGKTAKVDILDDGEIAHGSTEFLVLRAKPGVTDPDFVYYLSISPDLRDWAIAHMTGSSGRQRVSKADVKRFTVALPPLEQQRAIAEVMNALDDQIEHARLGIELAWRTEQTIVSHLLAERPTVPLGELAELDKGVSYKGKHVVEDPAARPLINLGNFGSGLTPRWEKLKRYDGDVKDRHLVPPGTVVVCATDMTSDRIVLGKALVVPDDLPNAAATHHLYAVRLIEGEDRLAHLVSGSLNHEPQRRRSAEYANGTTVLALPRDAVLHTPIPRPESVSEDEQALLSLSAARRTSLRSLVTRTAAIRDTLLPKLVSGEVNVENPEGLLEGAA